MDAQAEPERDFVISHVQPIFIVFDCARNASLQHVPELQVPTDCRLLKKQTEDRDHLGNPTEKNHEKSFYLVIFGVFFLPLSLLF